MKRFPILQKIFSCQSIHIFFSHNFNIIWYFSGTFKTIVYLGSVAKLYCFGKKHPIRIFRHLVWFHSGKSLSNSDHFVIDKNGNLVINGVTVEDSGEFVCFVNSKSGKQIFKHDVNGKFIMQICVALIFFLDTLKHDAKQYS